MELCAVHPCNLCREGFRMFSRGKEPCLSSSPASVCCLGRKCCSGCPRPTAQDDYPVLSHLLHLFFFYLSPFPVATQDETAFCSLNLRKPNALETLVCQNYMPLSVYLREVISTGLGRKDLPNILGTEMEVYDSRNLSSWLKPLLPLVPFPESSDEASE